MSACDNLHTNSDSHSCKTLPISDVAFDQMTRLLYSTDASIYQMMPVGVVKPRNEDEVVAAIEIAGVHNVPVLPRGGGSSLAGQAIGHALILDMSRYMNQVIARSLRCSRAHHKENQ